MLWHLSQWHQSVTHVGGYPRPLDVHRNIWELRLHDLLIPSLYGSGATYDNTRGYNRIQLNIWEYKWIFAIYRENLEPFHPLPVQGQLSADVALWSTPLSVTHFPLCITSHCVLLPTLIWVTTLLSVRHLPTPHLLRLHFGLPWPRPPDQRRFPVPPYCSSQSGNPTYQSLPTSSSRTPVWVTLSIKLIGLPLQHQYQTHCSDSWLCSLPRTALSLRVTLLCITSHPPPNLLTPQFSTLSLTSQLWILYVKTAPVCTYTPIVCILTLRWTADTA